MSIRIKNCFENLSKKNKSALISFTMAYDPDFKTSKEILNKLPENGVDILELGMPFSDPMADGKIIEAAGIRALNQGAKLDGVLEIVNNFRKTNDKTPIILMGYYNPIQHYGVNKFIDQAKLVGVDGLIIVDLPPEEDSYLQKYAFKNQIDLIKLVTPTTSEKRLKIILEKASGFLYYVAVAGVTGTKSATIESIKNKVKQIKSNSNLPVAVGFGIKTSDDVKQISKFADAVVVGSALINTLNSQGIDKALDFVNNIKNN